MSRIKANAFEFPSQGLPASGTCTLDFAAQAFYSHALNGNVTYAASNRASGRSVTVRVICDGTTRTLTFPAGWRFLGVKPTNIAANKVGALTVTSFGTTDDNCIAAWAVEP